MGIENIASTKNIKLVKIIKKENQYKAIGEKDVDGILAIGKFGSLEIEQVAKISKNIVFIDSSPDYKNYDALGKYVSDRAKLLGKDRTGLCAKHQRRISTEIKRARHLALLPFTPSLS